MLILDIHLPVHIRNIRVRFNSVPAAVLQNVRVVWKSFLRGGGGDVVLLWGRGNITLKTLLRFCEQKPKCWGILWEISFSSSSSFKTKSKVLYIFFNLIWTLISLFTEEVRKLPQGTLWCSGERVTRPVYEPLPRDDVMAMRSSLRAEAWRPAGLHACLKCVSWTDGKLQCRVLTRFPRSSSAGSTVSQKQTET